MEENETFEDAFCHGAYTLNIPIEATAAHATHTYAKYKLLNENHLNGVVFLITENSLVGDDVSVMEFCESLNFIVDCFDEFGDL